MGLPRYAVIVTFYNKENYAEQCIKSILAQKYEKIQLILVDDCSTDNTADILKRYENKADVILKDKNEGTAFAVNAGLEVMKADVELFQTFCGDDAMSKELVKKRVREFNSLPKNMGFLYDNFYILKPKPKPHLQIIRLGFPFNKDKLLLHCYVSGVCTYRRACYDEVGGYGYEGYTNEPRDNKPKGYFAHAEDYDYVLRVNDKFDGFYFDCDPAFTWTYRTGAGTKSLDREGVDYCRAKVQELAKKRRGKPLLIILYEINFYYDDLPLLFF
jgi:glycosyltransferase involved in cell wall biosynthesis